MQATSCCGCWSLRTGTIIIGVLQLTGLIIMLIMTFALNIEWQVPVIHSDPDTVKTVYTIYLCISIFAAIWLLVGVCKKDAAFMIPWSVLGMFGIWWGLINIIYVSTILFMGHVATQGIAFLVGGLLGLALYAYLWLVVYSYYLQLKRDKMNSRIGLHERPRNYQEA